MRERTLEIRQFITDRVEDHPLDIARVTGKRFGISQQAVGLHLREMVANGSLNATGKTRARRYSLRPIAKLTINLDLKGLEEHIPWEKDIAPHLTGLKDNVREICAYAFMEMLNNAIDHSGSETVLISLTYTTQTVNMMIIDKGVGIFQKIARELDLPDEREAILQLAKGKLTTDPKRHTGEGIFFTSRSVDIFCMGSGRLYFRHVRDGDWLIESEEGFRYGTFVDMTIDCNTTRTNKDLFQQFSRSPEECTFSKTHVPLRLAQYSQDNLLSRSQARRVLSRFDRFEEVLLDFSEVKFIGQAFADEIFRVYKSQHPDIKLLAMNANPDVAGMIHRAQYEDNRQKELFKDEDNAKT